MFDPNSPNTGQMQIMNALNAGGIQQGGMPQRPLANQMVHGRPQQPQMLGNVQGYVDALRGWAGDRPDLQGMTGMDRRAALMDWRSQRPQLGQMGGQPAPQPGPVPQPGPAPQFGGSLGVQNAVPAASQFQLPTY